MEFEQFDNRIYPAGDRFVADSLETISATVESLQFSNGGVGAKLSSTFGLTLTTMGNPMWLRLHSAAIAVTYPIIAGSNESEFPVPVDGKTGRLANLFKFPFHHRFGRSLFPAR